MPGTIQEWVGFFAAVVTLGWFSARLTEWFTKRGDKTRSVTLVARRVGVLLLAVGLFAWTYLGIHVLNEKTHFMSRIFSDRTETARKRAVAGLSRCLKTMTSWDKRNAIVATVPKIRGGVRGTELAQMLEDMTSCDRAEVLRAISGYIVYPLAPEEVEMLMSDMTSDDRAKSTVVLMEAQTKATSR